MLRRLPASNPVRQRKAQTVSFPAPTAGWVRNRNLAEPSQPGAPQGAEILENYFPTATSAILRRGSQTYAQLGDGSLPVTTMFKYVVGNNRRLFASTATTVYDITSVTRAYNFNLGVGDDAISTDDGDPIGENSTAGQEVITDALGGQWSTVQFATSGGVFLIGVNGESIGFIFDGTTFSDLEGGTPGITFPEGSTLTTADLTYVWAYKNRLWFIQKESLSAWYLPVDSIGGELTELPLGSELGRGGSLVFGQTWSLESGSEGGLSEQVVFATTEGEVAVYQGANPAEASNWSKVGVYRIGIPLGAKALVRAGGDLVIATNIGLIALSQAIQLDIAALAPAAVSYSIETAWNEAVHTRGSGWSCALWPEQQMLVVAPPMTEGTIPSIFVANARTGAWASFTNWNISCVETFAGRLLFGAEDGKIKDAMIGGSDDGIPYTGTYMPLFSDAGSPTSIKTAQLARATIRSGSVINERVSCRFDFDRTLPPPPDVALVPAGNEWDSAVWDQSVWNGPRTAIVSQRRHSVGGAGYRIAPVVQVTSGSIVPLDSEIVSLDATFAVGDVFT